MSDERRYTERELQTIIERAAERQKAARLDLDVLPDETDERHAASQDRTRS